MINIKFAKVRPDAIIPSKRVEDMGYDIYANFPDDFMVIHPNETRMIPTGIASCCDSGYGFFLKERGSTGTKGLGQRAGVIDSGFRGEWFAPITNHNDVPVVITKNDSAKSVFGESAIYYPYTKAIAQAVLIPVPETTVTEISFEELQTIPSERGAGIIGSSNK